MARGRRSAAVPFVRGYPPDLGTSRTSSVATIVVTRLSTHHCCPFERKEHNMPKETENKAVVGRWFTEFWGETCNLSVVDAVAAPDMLLKYSLHEPRRGRADIKAFMTDFRAAFPDLKFWGTADLIAEGDYVVGQWEGGGTHTG